MTNTSKELREQIEYMFKSCFQDGEAIALGRKSADGSPWKIRIGDFTDKTMDLLIRQLNKAVVEAKIDELVTFSKGLTAQRHFDQRIATLKQQLKESE